MPTPRKSGKVHALNDWIVASILFVCVFVGALLGIFLRFILPERYFTEGSKDVVRLGTGLVATMAALVLGLLVASAKSSFDVQKGGMDQLSANLILLDNTLSQYGPEARESRDTLQRIVSDALKRIWPREESDVSTFAPATMASGRTLYTMIQELTPTNDKQRGLKSIALQVAIELARTRWLLVAQEKSDAIPTPFLVVLVFWLTTLFVSFGLFAPPNPAVIATLMVCALSVSGAIFLILELADPFEGLIQVSSAPLRNAFALLGR
jgi:Protein of unknown function (DUF4239)